MSRVLAVMDYHAPCQHPDSFNFVESLADRIDPTHPVIIGDEVDLHSISPYPKHVKSVGAVEELARAREALKPLFRLFPRADVCNSNHPQRIERLAASMGIPPEAVRTVKEILKAPAGWNYAERHTIDGVDYVHGHRLRPSSGRVHLVAERAKRSVVYGHSHSQQGVAWVENIFAACGGCLGDPDSWALQYTDCPKQLGCVVVIDGAPIIVPMRLDHRERWDRKIRLP